MNKTLACVVLLLVTAFTLPVQGQTSSWLRGTWEGTGYQTDDASTWTMLLTAGRRRFRIQYPSLNCSGEWRLLHRNGNEARFRERISVGKVQCTDGGLVVVRKLNSRQIVYLFSNPGSRKVIASAVLNKR